MNPRTRKLGLLLAAGLVLVAGFVSFSRSHPSLAPVAGRPAGAGDRDAVPVVLGETAAPRIAAEASLAARLIDVSGPEAVRARLVQGRVVDAVSGRPVTRFRLFACRAEEGELLARAEQEPSRGVLRHAPGGDFELSGLLPGLYSVLVDPEAAGYERTVIHDVRVPGATPLVARVGRGAHVEGRVLDGLGRAAADLELALVRESAGAGEARERVRTTDAEGGFLFTCLEPGTYRLVARAAEPFESAPFRVEEHLRVERELVLPGANTLSVTVTGEDGEPLEGSQVLVAGRAGVLLRARADARGEARIEGLASRPYALQVVRPGFRTESRDLEVRADQELAIVLAPARR